MEDFIEFEGSKLYYTKSGAGPLTLVLFHGYGQSGQYMLEKLQGLTTRYTVFAVDLYFHGQSLWPQREPLEKSDWKQIITSFLFKENIDRFDVAGFSLGGKFALATLEAVPEKVSKLFLIAPDGIRTDFWYSLATYPIIIRRLFRSMVLHPGRFYSFARAMRKFGLMNKGMVRFAEAQMDTEEKRMRVYCTWVYFRHLKFDLVTMAGLLNTNRIPVVLIVGKYDRVIPPKKMERFVQLLNEKRVEILESGHQDLINMVGAFILG